MARKRKQTNDVSNNVQPVVVVNAGVIEKLNVQINKNENKNETNDFDLEPEKKPKLSTLKTQYRKLRKLSNSRKIAHVINEFDRVKFAVNLNRYGEQIDFSIINLEETTEPRKSPANRYFELNSELKNKYIDISTTLSNIDNITEATDNLFTVDEIEYEEELNTSVFINDDNETIRELAKELESKIQEYNDIIINSQVPANTGYDYNDKNYGIYFKDWTEAIGLNNLYVENKFLVIDITGKFMASAGYLGKIDFGNIRQALQRILDLNVINFDIDELYNVAQIFLCDLCVDIEYESAEKVHRTIQGVSSLFPIGTNRHNIWKYHRRGLMLRSKGKNAGESLCMYHKGEELSYRNNTRYLDIIGQSGQELAQRTLRIEHHLHALDKIRNAFNIDLSERRVVLLCCLHKRVLKII